MASNFTIPASYSLIQRGKVWLLLKDTYKDLLLRQGIDDIETFLEKNRKVSTYLTGRKAHPVVPLEEGKRMVIRRYSHGGLLRPLTGNRFFFGSRSFYELALTEEVRSSGISTIEPLGANRSSSSLSFYQATLLSLEIPHSADLIQYLQKLGPHPAPEAFRHKRKIVRSAGALLRRFHDAGFFHGDLQLKNLLVAEDQVLLIDFDRSCRKETLSKNERIENLLRLDRSVTKWKRHGLPVTVRDRWRFFLAYSGGDRELREVLRRKMRWVFVRYLIHRIGWKMGNIFASGQ